MSRRRFLQSLVAGTAGVAVLSRGAAAGTTPPPSSVAITIDDPATVRTPMLTAAERDARIRGTLREHGAQAALFVCGHRVRSAAGRRLLDAWDEDGHFIANHSDSHPYFHAAKVNLETFTEDFERGHEAIDGYQNSRRLFRFPYLKEGDTAGKRDGMRRVLDLHGYANGHVTIDTSDWYFDERLRKRLERDPSADLESYRRAYLDHLWDRAGYYDRLGREILGRPLRHTILLHHTLLNSLFLGDVLARFRDRGWIIAGAGETYEDALFQRRSMILPAGESLIWALARESGRYQAELRYPGEDGDYEAAALDSGGL